MQQWDEALRRPAPPTRTCASSTGPRRRKTSWFIDDGIHYNSPGYAARSRLIADALAHAFPVSGASGASSCVVH